MSVYALSCEDDNGASVTKGSSIANKKRRPLRRKDERAGIVAESYAHGVSATARRHDVSRSQIYYWRSVADQSDNKRASTGEVTNDFASVVVDGLRSSPEKILKAPVPLGGYAVAPSTAAITLEFGPVRLILPADMAMEQVARLVLALRAER